MYFKRVYKIFPYVYAAIIQIPLMWMGVRFDCRWNVASHSEPGSLMPSSITLLCLATVKCAGLNVYHGIVLFERQYHESTARGTSSILQCKQNDTTTGDSCVHSSLFVTNMQVTLVIRAFTIRVFVYP
jgi:hypothetical protein